MKYLLPLLLIFTMQLYAQGNEEYSPRVLEFMNILEDYKLNLNYIPHLDEFNITDEELNNIIKKMYVAIEDDPEGYTKYLAKYYQEYGRAFKEGQIDNNKPSINNILGLIHHKIADKYSKKYHAIITTPYFLRVKITDKSPGVYTDRQENPHDQTILKGQIEEIIKGKKRFNEGDIISFMYLNKPTKCLRNYEVGKSYFIPFWVSTLEVSNYEGLSLQWFDCKGSYLIKDGTITIPDNYFEIAEEIRWEEFKVKFIEKYIISN